MQLVGVFVGIVLAVSVSTLRVAAQEGPSTGDGQLADTGRRDSINRGAVGLIIDPGASSDTTLATDLARLLNSKGELRILPVLGEGSVQSIDDLLYLRGIDVALVHADVLDLYRRDGLIEGLQDKIRYIAKLTSDEVHLLARKSITSVDDLAGRRVNFGSVDSGGFLSASFIFEELGIEVDVTTFELPVALEELRDGGIDAMFLVEAAPLPALRAFDDQDQIHLLDVPRGRIINSVYLDGELTSDDYPALINPGEIVETIAVAEVLTAYNWPEDHPRYRNIERFAEGLFSNFDQLTQPPFSPGWQDVNLDDPLPGWVRLSLVDRLLSQ